MSDDVFSAYFSEEHVNMKKCICQFLDTKYDCVALEIYFV